MKYSGVVEVRMLRKYTVDAADEDQAYDELLAIAGEDQDGVFADEIEILDRDVYSLDVIDFGALSDDGEE